MSKYKEYYFFTKVSETSSRNNSTPMRYYSWTIRNKEMEVLESSDELFESKADAEGDAIDHINEYYQDQAL